MTADTFDTNASEASKQSSSVSEELELGQKLKLIRELFGLSQRELAKRAGVTNSSISMIEQGQVSPSVQSLQRILAGLPVSLAHFFAWHPPRNASSLTTDLPSTGASLNLRQLHLNVGEQSEFVFTQVGIQGFVAFGAVNLQVNTHRFELNPGDSFYIPQGAFYQVRNGSVGAACLALCWI